MGKENLDYFTSLDIRVGVIVDAKDFPEAIKPSYILEIDFGKEIGVRKTSAQITNYSIEALVGRKCIGIINLGEKQIGPIMSQCLILGSVTDNNIVNLLTPDDMASIGDKIA
tara:strand:- start:4996 stop:5331 length:336 start_codon:yes stop_codon:yes gene_type:complete